MNGIEKITARITAEAEAEAAAILSEAESAAAAVRSEYAGKAEAEYSARLLSGTEEIEQNKARIDRAARLEAKKAILSAKQELLSEAYASAGRKLLSLPEEDYAAFAAELAGNAARTGDETVILNAADRARVGEKVVAAANALLQDRGLPGKLTLSDETREISGGVVLRKGSVEVNCTVESLLEWSHSRLDADVAGILFR